MEDLKDFLKLFVRNDQNMLRQAYRRAFLLQRERFMEHDAGSRATMMVDVNRLLALLKETENKDQKRRLFYLEDDEYMVGRGHDSTIALPHISISKIHAKIAMFDDENGTVTDLGSTNGTFLNELQLEKNRPHPVKDGDKISFGSLGFQFYSAPTFFRMVETMVARMRNR